MRKKLIIDSPLLDVMLTRLCRQLIEHHSSFENTALLALQPNGVPLAELLMQRLTAFVKKAPLLGYLDATFHRDDFRQRRMPKRASVMKIDFIIEGKQVVLIDDVLYTGRTVRAALDAMIAFGRPAKVELLVLIDRKHSRDLPIAADYVGKEVETLPHQRVLVEVTNKKQKSNCVWLFDENL